MKKRPINRSKPNALDDALVSIAIVSPKSKRVTHTDDNEVIHLIGNMTGRKQRRVAAAYAKWLKREVKP